MITSNAQQQWKASNGDLPPFKSKTIEPYLMRANASKWDQLSTDDYSQTGYYSEYSPRFEISSKFLASNDVLEGSSSTICWRGPIVAMIHQEISEKLFMDGHTDPVMVTTRGSVRSGEQNKMKKNDQETIYPYNHFLKVDPLSPAENLFRLFQLTDYTVEKIADLLNVEIKTVILWRRGYKIGDEESYGIARVLEVVKFVDRGEAKVNAKLLDEIKEGKSGFGLIKNRQYSEAMFVMGRGSGRRQSLLAKQDQVGNGFPIFFHEKADGNEELEPLPNELEPKSKPIPVQKI